MNDIKVFENSEFGQVRVIERNGEPWFVGKDVAESLGYSNTKDAISNHVDEEDRMIIQRSGNATFEIPNRGVTIINESGLYSLIFGSKMESAKRFKRWVTSDVLPSIRKTGAYAMNEVASVNAVAKYDFMDNAVNAQFASAVRMFREKTSEKLFAKYRDEWDRATFGKVMATLWDGDESGLTTAVMHFDEYKELVSAVFEEWTKPEPENLLESILELPEQVKLDPIYDVAILNCHKRDFSRDAYHAELVRILGDDEKQIANEMKLYDAVMTPKSRKPKK